MSGLTTPEWRAFKRARMLGEFANLPSHVQTAVRRLVHAELKALAIGDQEIGELRDKRHAADWELQYRQYQRRQIADWDRERPDQRREALEARIAEMEARIALLTFQEGLSPATSHRLPASGLRSLLRRLAGGR